MCGRVRNIITANKFHQNWSRLSSYRGPNIGVSHCCLSPLQQFSTTVLTVLVIIPLYMYCIASVSNVFVYLMYTGARYMWFIIYSWGPDVNTYYTFVGIWGSSNCEWCTSIRSTCYCCWICSVRQCNNGCLVCWNWSQQLYAGSCWLYVISPPYLAYIVVD